MTWSDELSEQVHGATYMRWTTNDPPSAAAVPETTPSRTGRVVTRTGPSGAERGMTSYADVGFSRFLRGAFLSAAGFGSENLERPVVGIERRRRPALPRSGRRPRPAGRRPQAHRPAGRRGRTRAATARTASPNGPGSWLAAAVRRDRHSGPPGRRPGLHDRRVGREPAVRGGGDSRCVRSGPATGSDPDRSRHRTGGGYGSPDDGRCRGSGRRAPFASEARPSSITS